MPIEMGGKRKGQVWVFIYLWVSTIFASLQNAMNTLLAESVDVFLAFLTSPNVCHPA